MTDFVKITDDGELITSKMPPDETIVEVQLADGSTMLAWYSCNLMEAGDWDFVPVKEGEDEPNMNADSIADKVVGWRAH